jgi:hypothetical protein
LAVPAQDLEKEGSRLEGLGVHWLAPLQEITSGALAGVLWRYGDVSRQYGGLRLEITAWPK